MEVLTSLQNPRIKQLVGLRESRQRKKSGLTRIDGGRELLRALQSGLVPETVFVREDLQADGELATAITLCRERGHPLQPVSEAVYSKIRYGERDEGICAAIAWSAAPLPALIDQPDAFWLVVEGVEKPGNLGALLRSADAAGVHAVILADPACDPSNPNVVRASMGTLFTQPVVRGSTDEVISFLQSAGAAIVTLRPQAVRPWHAASLGAGKVAVVSGAEDRGLGARWQEVATEDLVIPMAGVADSLNVSAATAILLYEVVRQRGNQSTA